ncbi:hypothetical protein RAD15_19360 [Bradyrhizobium sp. 14AA]
MWSVLPYRSLKTSIHIRYSRSREMSGKIGNAGLAKTFHFGIIEPGKREGPLSKTTVLCLDP